MHTSVYHKVDAFNFHVVLLTFPDKQIPYRMGLRVFASQVLRYLRICSHIKYVISKVQKSLNVLVSCGYKLTELRRATEQLLNRHVHILARFGITSGRHLTLACGMK